MEELFLKMVSIIGNYQKPQMNIICRIRKQSKYGFCVLKWKLNVICLKEQISTIKESMVSLNVMEVSASVEIHHLESESTVKTIEIKIKNNRNTGERKT